MKWKVAKGVYKYFGLMFKKKSPGLIFIFDKETTQSIHSYFCRTFRAKWFDAKGKKIADKIIKPFYWDIKPKKPYCFLTEEILYQ